MTEPFPESRIRALIHAAADTVPADISLAPRVRASSAEAAARSPRPLRPRRKKYAAIALLVAATLLFSAFAWERAAIFQWLGDRSLETITLDNATTINQQVTLNGITLHVEQAYADAARTAITLRITSPQSNQTAVPGPMEVVDSASQAYPAIIGQQVQNAALEEFVPLPDDRLGTTQKLTLVVHTMQFTGADGPGQRINGNWRVTFQLPTRSGRMFSLNAAPVSHHGLTLQPQSITVAPSGVRLMLHISGLTPGAPLFPLTLFATHREISGSEPGSHMGASISGSSGGALLRLTTASGQQFIPAWVGAPTEPASANGDSNVSTRPTIGPSGAVTIEAVFYSTLPTTATSVHLTLDNLQVAGAGAITDTVVSGPWDFALTLTMK